jgi:hypothetical protein
MSHQAIGVCCRVASCRLFDIDEKNSMFADATNTAPGEVDVWGECFGGF